MNSFHVLSLTGLATAAIVVLTNGVVVLRSGTRSLAYWLFGWAGLLAALFIALLVPDIPELEPLGPLFTSFVPVLMLLGAYAHVKRPEPGWLLIVGFGIAVARSALLLLGHPEAMLGIGMVVEPVMGLATAWVVARPRLEPASPIPTVDRAIAVGFVFYAGTEFFDGYCRLRGTFGWANWLAWFVVAPPLAMAQIAFHVGRLGRLSRDHAEKARAYAERLEILGRSSQDLLAEFDERGFLTFVSAGAAELLGGSTGSYVGRNVLDFLIPESESSIRDVLRLRGRLTPEDVDAAIGTSHLVKMPDGSPRWFEFFGSTYRTSTGELRIVTRTRDVSVRIEAEQALRQSEARLRRAEQIAAMGHWEFDARSKSLIFSQESSRLHGLEDRAGPVDMALLRSRVHPADLGPVLEASRQSFASGKTAEFEYRIVKPETGAVRTLRAFGEADRDDEGTLVRIVGVTRDITEQVELTNRLRRGQQRLQALFDSNLVSVYIADRQFIREANDAFLSMLGYTREDLPLDWRLLTAPEYKAQGEQMVAMAHPEEVPQPFEREFIARDGRRVPMLLSFAVLSRETSILIGADLTERKQAEAERERHRHELEETVVQRTRELVESRNRLIERERLAAVGTLTAGIAHQINNPIGAILSCSEYALLCRDDEDVLGIYERALKDNLAEARRCAMIVRSMLQFSRDQPTAKWIEDLVRVTRRAHRAIGTYAKDRAATVTFEPIDDQLLVRMSPIEIEQAIVNVLRNAIESSETGARVAIRLARRDKSARLEVTDDGRGIAPEHIDHLFDPFFSTRTREGGTGLGLSVAHGVVVDHGGQIRIESIPGTGTRVTITLPIDESGVDGEFGRISGD